MGLGVGIGNGAPQGPADTAGSACAAGCVHLNQVWERSGRRTGRWCVNQCTMGMGAAPPSSFGTVRGAHLCVGASCEGPGAGGVGGLHVGVLPLFFFSFPPASCSLLCPLLSTSPFPCAYAVYAVGSYFGGGNLSGGERREFGGAQSTSTRGGANFGENQKTKPVSVKKTVGGLGLQ